MSPSSFIATVGYVILLTLQKCYSHSLFSGLLVELLEVLVGGLNVELVFIQPLAEQCHFSRLTQILVVLGIHA